VVNPLQDLLHHQAWADAAFFRAWQVSGMLQDPELRMRMDHQVTTQEAFLQVLRGEEVPQSDRPTADYHELLARCEAAHLELQALLDGLDENGLARQIRVPWFPEPPCVTSLSEALLQVCLHGQHHRGQNMTRLKALGAKARNVDYIIWLWKQRPRARWS